jgi:hypothetical protein
MNKQGVVPGRARRWLVPLLLAGSMVPPGLAAEAEPAQAPAEAAVFLLADPQLHNVHAAQLKQMLLPANWLSKVAIRPPELNLLAPLVLRHTLRQREALGAGDLPTVLLGDATNIGCSGEWEEFVAEMDRGAGPLWLMAHGNHDTYLMGTTNVFTPTEASWIPDGGMATSPMPLDESYFQPRAVPVVASRSPWNPRGLWKKNWPDACARPASAGGEPGSPMNKPRWLARYVAQLQPHGLEWFPEGGHDDSGARIGSRVAEGSRLAAMDYRMTGRWYRAVPGFRRGQYDYARASSSYVVQSFRLGAGHRMILIDTSTCPFASLSIEGNAGSNACIGSEQFKDIGLALAQARAAGDRVVVGAHYPLAALKPGERDELIRRMAEADPKGWTFVSGHSHDAASMLDYGSGIDLNIGSTTDWPMEAHVVRFGEALPRLTSTSLSDTVAAIQLPAYPPERSELCRHYKVAMALSQLGASGPVEVGAFAPMSKDECVALQKQWLPNSQALLEARGKISDRFDQDEAFARRVLAIAAGASLREYHDPHFASLIK